MASLVRKCPTPWSQQEMQESLRQMSVPSAGGTSRHIRGTADYNPDVDYKIEGSDPVTLKLSMRKRKTLIQNIQNWSDLEPGHCIKGQ